MINAQEPLVSVIIPFFNEESFLEETILSVLHQDYKNWELLLIDDGSTNKSTDIAKQFAADYADKVKYVDHPGHTNQGASTTRNKGIQNARGTLVAFLDADDIFEQNYLKNQVELLKKTKASMICEATEYWYSWNDPLAEDNIIPVGAPQDQLYQPQELNLLLYPLNGYQAAPCMCGIVILKEALVRNDGFEESFTSLYDDQVFLSKIYYNEPVYISSACNNRYRQRTGSLMSTAQKKEDYIKIRMQFLEWFKAYLENRDIRGDEVYKRVEKNLFPLKHPILYKLFYGLPKRVKMKIQRMLDF